MKSKLLILKINKLNFRENENLRYTSHHLRVGELSSTSLRRQYLHRLFGVLHKQFVFSFLKITDVLAVVGLRYMCCRSKHCGGSSLLPSGFLLVTVSGGYCLCVSFSFLWLLLLQTLVLGLPASVVGVPGLSSCGTWT